MFFLWLIVTTSQCSEPPVGLVVLKPSLGMAYSPTLPELSLSDGVISGPSDRLPSFAALSSPVEEGTALVGNHPCAGTEVGIAKGRRSVIEGS